MGDRKEASRAWLEMKKNERREMHARQQQLLARQQQLLAESSLPSPVAAQPAAAAASPPGLTAAALGADLNIPGGSAKDVSYGQLKASPRKSLATSRGGAGSRASYASMIAGPRSDERSPEDRRHPVASMPPSAALVAARHSIATPISSAGSSRVKVGGGGRVSGFDHTAPSSPSWPRLEMFHSDVSHLDWSSRGLTRIEGRWPHAQSLLSLSLSRNLIDHMANLPQTLVKLDMSHNFIQRIEGLGSIKSLEVLNVSHNKLRTMAGLAFCPNITELHVDDNRIRAVSHIDHLKKLQVLQLRDNMLSNAEALTTLKHNTSLKLLHLAGNRVANNAPSRMSHADKHHAPAASHSQSFDHQTYVCSLLPNLDRLDNQMLKVPAPAAATTTAAAAVTVNIGQMLPRTQAQVKVGGIMGPVSRSSVNLADIVSKMEPESSQQLLPPTAAAQNGGGEQHPYYAGVIEDLAGKMDKLFSWHLVEMDLVSKQQEQLTRVNEELQATKQTLSDVLGGQVNVPAHVPAQVEQHAALPQSVLPNNGGTVTSPGSTVNSIIKRRLDYELSFGKMLLQNCLDLSDRNPSGNELIATPDELRDLKSRFDGLKTSLADVKQNVVETCHLNEQSSDNVDVRNRLDQLETVSSLLNNVILLLQRQDQAGYSESLAGLRKLIEIESR